ncbi:NUDIX domain-containing protein [Pricia sp.]|uniref:NUDIX domain-containing protein n=1 Tax=Pricia sp. TaxID=2268138 RepID=UPI003593D736
MKNGNIKNTKKEILSDNWYTLNKYTFDYQKEDGSWETQERESYDRGNGACILLYNTQKGTVILTRQFRMPTYVNGNENGMMIEVCAGVLDGDEPEVRIKKEAEEETGFRIEKVEKILTGYTSPGAVTEIMHFFIGEYDANLKIGEGGGAEDETENIEVLEYAFDEALRMIGTGEIMDVKTIVLLQHAQIQGIFL